MNKLILLEKIPMLWLKRRAKMVYLKQPAALVSSWLRKKDGGKIGKLFLFRKIDQFLKVNLDNQT